MPHEKLELKCHQKRKGISFFFKQIKRKLSHSFLKRESSKIVTSSCKLRYVKKKKTHVNLDMISNTGTNKSNK